MNDSRGNESATHFEARVLVFPRPEILDPQGKALSAALTGIGFVGVGDVRAGKSFRIELEERDRDAATAAVEKMCEQLLANTIIEDYSFELVESSNGGARS